MRILLSVLLASVCAFGADASGRGVSKSEYLDLTRMALCGRVGGCRRGGTRFVATAHQLRHYAGLPFRVPPRR